MSSDGSLLVALVNAPGSDYKETALATWDLNNLSSGPVITPSGKNMKFVRANALKAGKVLVTARQEWSGPLEGCGEGKRLGSTATFVSKNYLTDAKHTDFAEAFVSGFSRHGVSKSIEKCLEITGSARLVSNLPLDPNNVIIQRAHGANLQSDYFLYDLQTEKTKLLLRGGRHARPGLFHPRDGKVLVRTQTEPLSSTEYEQNILIYDDKTDAFQVHDKLTTKLSDRYTVSVVGIDDATGHFYVLTDMFSEQTQAWMYDPKTRSFASEHLVAHPKYGISRLIFGSQPSNFNQLIGFSVSGPRTITTFVEPKMRAIHEGLKQSFKDQSVSISSYNDDLSKVLFITDSGSHPPAYHLLLDGKQVQTLGRQRPWIDSKDIGTQKWVTYTARDGLEIPAILDLPAGWSKSDGPLPTIINPHGGPWARDRMGWDFSGWVPLLTSNGYAVLRPQYRGSAGLGRKLWIAGDAEWGKAMQDDKDDGAKWLVSQGITDPDRIAIFGYSYGGFAAAAAVVRPNSPYQCAISGAPVTNLAKIGNTWSRNRLQRILQGTTVKGMDPMRNTDKANIPVLLFVGDRDVRTPSWHAKDFYKAVKGTVPAKLEIIEDLPHSFPWYYRHQVEMLTMIGDYLENDCGPGGL
ncbi:MAG: prolyl oligopeptidase family serine peptidase [Xanthomonadales bacterium]|nr:prolyl oligopeptidase family serine peptidase [Xanthomonadales bacterium]